MPRDDRNILDVLKAELNYVKKGGYGRSPREPWRAQLVFEDSPTCMNYDSKENRAPCAECLLMQFVPDDKRRERVPCRHIPLTSYGDTCFTCIEGERNRRSKRPWPSGWKMRLRSWRAWKRPAWLRPSPTRTRLAESLV